MSTHSARDQVEFDFWEFVSCAKCRMPFALDNGAPTVPFWLTECGHVICNSHLNPDQSCSQCGAREIQLAPLQREMDVPMSQWFQSIPQALDAVAFTAKFQQEALASQLRYHRSRQDQYRMIVERLKRDISELKKENESLRRENLHLHHQTNDRQYIINENGKRQIIAAQITSRPRTGSSNHSVNTPLAPNRLSLQPGQQIPALIVQDSGPSSRPVSGRPLEQYAYKPSENLRLPTSTSTHAQAGPHVQVFHRTQLSDDPNVMPPPPSRFKPASSSTIRQPTRGMAPPHTPQHYPASRPSDTTQFIDPFNQSFFPPRPTGVPSTSSGQRPQPNTAAPQRFFTPAVIPRIDVSNSNGRPGQRMPFVPDSQGK